MFKQGGGYKLVWTNPNPNVSFTSLNLTIDMSKYKMIFVKFKFNTDIESNVAYFGVKKNVNTTTRFLGFNANTVGTGRRTAYFDDTSIHITTCDNIIANIPLEIYATTQEIG